MRKSREMPIHDWNAPDTFPDQPGEYVSALEPGDASPATRRFWNGSRWSNPYHSNWPEATKARIRAEPSDFRPYWKRTEQGKDATPVVGFFVDWDGNTRRIESPGDGFSCKVVRRVDYTSVDVVDPAGFVCHEATYFRTLADVEAAGVTINLI